MVHLRRGVGNADRITVRADGDDAGKTVRGGVRRGRARGVAGRRAAGVVRRGGRLACTACHRRRIPD